VYMRSQKFDLEGHPIEVDPLSRGEFARRFLEKKPGMENIHKDNYLQFLQTAYQDEPVEHDRHLFSPIGFLDDSWYHRSYWVYGKHFTGGWNGYYLAGKFAPAGRILVFNENCVWGFGRKPQYFRWTTPLEYHVFSSPKTHQIGTSVIEEGRQKGRLKVDKSIDYNWSQDAPLLVRSMVLADNNLFIAGPPDLLDEVAILRKLDDPETEKKLQAQAAALEDEKGAILRILSAGDGTIKHDFSLESIPVWDGMIAAYGNLYMSLSNGKVVCYEFDDKSM